MINNTTTKDSYTTTGNLSTVYPITFQGATDDNGAPMLDVILTYGSILGHETLVYNVDYELVYEQVDDVLEESLNDPVLQGIRLLNEEYAAYGNTLDIYRNTPLIQDIDFQVGRIDPEQTERAVDLSVLRDQELQRKLDVAIATPEDHEQRIEDCENAIGDLQSLVPAQATTENQLADKNFVNSSIATATATFKGTYNSLEELEAVPDVDENDYGFVVSVDSVGNVVYSRYKYAGGQWLFEYDLNNSSFTAAQWAAINSNITPALVAKLVNMPILIKSISAALDGTVTVTADSPITTITFKKLYGGTTIDGATTITGATAVFVPTTTSDITVDDWTVEII